MLGSTYICIALLVKVGLQAVEENAVASWGAKRMKGELCRWRWFDKWRIGRDATSAEAWPDQFET